MRLVEGQKYGIGGMANVCDWWNDKNRGLVEGQKDVVVGMVKNMELVEGQKYRFGWRKKNGISGRTKLWNW